MTCYKCLSKDHECTVSDQQAELMRQKNLDGILAARGAPAVNAVLEEHHGPAATNFMAGMSDMQAFESLTMIVRIFNRQCVLCWTHDCH
ncbi:MAG: hypothetical protein GY696_16710 [Gammaproteobacteria bacterium]|nr:hypothetical protein [Gammaproteobacteria bacterium]